MQSVLRSVATLSGMLLSSVVIAGPDVFQEEYAVCDQPIEQQLVRSVAIGCLDVDAALGCNPGQALTLRVRFTAPATANARARLTITNLASIAPLSISPAAQRTGAAFIITPGVTIIRGWAVDSDPAPVIRTSLLVSDAWLTTLQSQQRGEQISLRFMQVAGSQPVSDVSLNALYSACPMADETGDRIIITGNTTGRNAVALLDGRRMDCVPLEEHVGPDVMMVENLVPPAGCSPARATVFAHNKAVEFRANTDATWKTSEGDELSVPLHDPVIEHVNIWLLYDSCGSSATCSSRAQSLGGVMAVAEASLNLAKDRYRSLFGGVSFKIIDKVDLTASTNGKVVAARELYCLTSEPIKETIRKVKDVKELGPANPSGEVDGGRLDLMFVAMADGYGAWCGPRPVDEDEETAQGADIIVLTSLIRDTTLAHEIGHALLNSGSHAGDPGSGFNGVGGTLMHAAGKTGGYLTIGQLFRMSLLHRSALNRHHARPAAAGTLVCDVFSKSDDCPSACFDVLRDVSPVGAGGPQCATSE